MSGIYLSVIIPTHNRKDMLIECLDSIYSQSLPAGKYEVLVVDDGSSDGTKEALEGLQKKHTNLRFIRQARGGPAAARNKGAHAARGEIFVFTDSDCKLPSDFLAKIADFFKRRPQIAAIAGKSVPVFRNPLFSALSGLYRLKYKNESEQVYSSKDPLFILGADNAAARKEIFVEAGGFDTKFFHPSGEDVELGYRILARGHKTAVCPDIILDHYMPTINHAALRCYRFGLADTLNYKTYFRGQFTIHLSASRRIHLYRFPVSGCLQIGVLKVMILAVVFMFIYFPAALAAALAYLVYRYWRIRLIGGTFWQYVLYNIYSLTIESFFLAGHLAGSIVNRLIYL